MNFTRAWLDQDLHHAAPLLKNVMPQPLGAKLGWSFTRPPHVRFVSTRYPSAVDSSGSPAFLDSSQKPNTLYDASFFGADLPSLPFFFSFPAQTHVLVRHGLRRVGSNILLS